MPSCLGLYIENNLIKYAKVSKNNDNIKVESFGVKFYENIVATVKQIVEETYSFKIPIAINSDDEWYNEIEVFNLLTPNDMKKAIETEFENLCYDKDVNKNTYEQRHIFANTPKGDDKLKAIHIAVPKVFLEQRKNQFAEYRTNKIVPISVSIPNLIKKDRKGTTVFVNIEKNTTITKVTDGIISSIDILEVGSQEILDKIARKENSYAKAYEICKNATIYTETDSDLQYEDSEYLDDIMPTLFEIMSKVKSFINESIERISNVYITGTGALVNNIDIYFQDYVKDVHCEILKPSFISNNSKINIKDYIEVNSAISIALQGLEKNNNDINFKKDSKSSKIFLNLNNKASDIMQSDASKKVTNFFGKFSGQATMITMTFVMITILYFVGNMTINSILDNKIKKAETSISDTNARINKIKEYNNDFNSQISRYQSIINNIQNLNNANSENRRYRNTIPNLLNNIMAVIPKGVEMVSIKNTVNTHIVIEARTTEYEQMAYFKAKLETEGILKNLVSDTGTLEGSYLTGAYFVVTIEGELP